MRVARLPVIVVVAAVSLAAHANPDIWVKAQYVYHLDSTSVTGITLAWRFDRYFSNKTITDADVNDDGAFSNDEVLQVRTAAFDPLAEKDFHLHIVVGGERQDFEVTEFDARVDADLLVYRFKAEFAEPVNYRDAPMTVSLHDDEIVFDFAFAEKDFLLVDGPFDPACRFSVGRGKGILSGHKQAITIKCGG